MAIVLVASQPGGILIQRVAQGSRLLEVPVAGTLASINTTVFADAGGTVVLAPEAFISNADGELPGYVAGGGWMLTVGTTSVPFIAVGGDVAGLPPRVDALESGNTARDAAIAANGTAITGKVATTALDTDATLAANSDAKIATQKATKAYVDAEAGARGSADSALSTAIGAETTNRTTADNTLRGQAVAFAVALGG